MKTILKIMKNELRMLFCSPIAWIVLVIFFFHAGSSFCDVLETNLKWKAQGSGLNRMTYMLFVSYFGLFSTMLNKIFFYFPLLTMGIMSKEYSDGSISLLYSSPISNRKIIWGKYLALVAFSFSFIAIFSLFIIYGLIVIPGFETGMVLAGLLGFILMCCAYSAIGLFMSCLTRYQVVAAIGTFAVLALLNNIGNIGQGNPLVRDITYWFSINDRTSLFVLGMIRSEDVVYFLTIIAMFLSFTLAKLQFERGRVRVSLRVSRYICIIALACVVGYVSSRPKLMYYLDLTTTKSNTLTPASQAIMEQLEGPMTVTTYVNLLDNDPYSFFPKLFKNDTKMFANYLRFKPDIKLKYVYYYHDCVNSQLDVRFPNMKDPASRAKIIARGYKKKIEDFLTPVQIDSLVDLSGEEYLTTREITYNGKSVFLRMYNDMTRYPGEAEISAAMRRFTDENPPVIAFAAGNGERSIYRMKDKDFYTFGRNIKMRHSLSNQGFDAIEINLDDVDRVPDNILALVLGDPQSQYSVHQTEVIKEYIYRGGDLIITASESSRDFLNPIVSELGLEFSDGIVVKAQEDNSPEFLVCDISPKAKSVSGSYAYLRGMNYKVTAPRSIPISQICDKGYLFIPVFGTDTSGCWIERNTSNFIDEVPVYEPQYGDLQWNDQPLMLGAVKKFGDRIQKIAVLSNADCISNFELTSTRKDIKSANFSLVIETFRWLTDGQYPVDVSRPSGRDNSIKADYDQIGLLKGIFVWFFPLLLAALGTFICVRRYRQ